MSELLARAAALAAGYVASLPERRVSPDPDAVTRLAQLDIPFPEEPVDPLAVLEELDSRCTPATMAMPGPRFFGFVTGGSLPAALAANWLAGAWDQNSALHNAAPATAVLERIALGWLLDALDLPRECAGAFVTGATVANFTALAAARHAVLAAAGWDVEGEGLFGAPPITVVVGAEAHPTLFKSLGMLGLGRNRVVRVPVDAQGRMRAEAIPAIAGPAIVCAQVGNVNTGACDAVPAIRAAIAASGAWLHVDGAFGLWARAAPAHAHLVQGLECADSWATDAHKWLNVPYDSGLAFVRDAHALQASMAISAAYLPTASTARNPSDFTPELSRRARGVEVWAALRSLGRRGLSEMIERHCRQARRFADGFRAAGYAILNDVVLNQVLVAFGDVAVTQRVVGAIQAEGTCWCGLTAWQGRAAMRISVVSWMTTDADVERSLEAMLRVAHEQGARPQR